MHPDTTTQRQRSEQDSGPSGATDRPDEREQKFVDEGGGQPQGKTPAAPKRRTRSRTREERAKR